MDRAHLTHQQAYAYSSALIHGHFAAICVEVIYFGGAGSKIRGFLFNLERRLSTCGSRTVDHREAPVGSSLGGPPQAYLGIR
jgi:hypothetical protein